MQCQQNTAFWWNTQCPCDTLREVLQRIWTISTSIICICVKKSSKSYVVVEDGLASVNSYSLFTPEPCVAFTFNYFRFHRRLTFSFDCLIYQTGRASTAPSPAHRPSDKAGHESWTFEVVTTWREKSSLCNRNHINTLSSFLLNVQVYICVRECMYVCLSLRSYFFFSHMTARNR